VDLGRRLTPVEAPPTDDAGDAQLLARLRAEIEYAGPITFARFMQRALYEPELGYYATASRRPTRAGDFLTAPELHPVFGRCVAHQLLEMWHRLGRPDPFVLREYGAGRGALVTAVIAELEGAGPDLLDSLAYQPRDMPLQLAELEARLASVGRTQLLERGRANAAVVGCVLANEFADALPVHLVVVVDGELRELYVDLRDDRLVETIGSPSSPALGAWFDDTGVKLRDGQRAEVNLALFDWLAEVGNDLQRGYALVIDYGASPEELYAQRRRSGTLRAFRQQHVASDPLRGVGHQDLTAHVDLAALDRAARGAGLTVLGRNSQAEFLIGCGLEEVMAAERQRAADDWQAILTLRSAVGRLLDPRAMGGYWVVALSRGVAPDPPLRGLAWRRPARA
jgi:SAM-dependent MidA family methyltransferase